MRIPSRILVGLVAMSAVACVPVSTKPSPSTPMRTAGEAAPATLRTPRAPAEPDRGAPAAPGEMLLTQPDGTAFQARQWGDGSLNGYETVAGYTIVKDAGGVWRLADGLTPDGRLRASALRADSSAPTADMTPHLRPDPSTAELLEPPSLSPGADEAPFEPSIGTQKSLVILVSFTDQPSLGSTEAQWADKFFGATGSVKDFYTQASYGQFTIAPATESYGTSNNGVVGWLPLTRTHPNYVVNGNTQSRQTVFDAVTAANPYVDFATFDTDGDGDIEPTELHVTVITAGYETSYGGTSNVCGKSTWGHRWATDTPNTAVLDGKNVGNKGYTMFGEWHCSTYDNPGHMATIGIMTHEIGHDIGWPDLYDTDQSSNGVGNWSVMGFGSWNFAPGGYQGASPALPDAWSRVAQGWVTPTQITGTSNGVTIGQAATQADVKQLLANPGGVDWKMNSNPGTGQYFLVENRQKTGYDAGLPGCGLLVWHINETAPSDGTANANDASRLVDLEEADGLGHLDSRTNRGDTGDPYPGPSGKLAFNTFSNPNSRLINGTPSKVGVQLVSTSCAPTMTANFSTAALCPPDDTNEPNQGIATATPLAASVVVAGATCDDDYYAFNATRAGFAVAASIDFVHADGDLDLKAYDSGGNEVASSVSTDDDETVGFTPAVAGTYYLRVYGKSAAKNYYTITANQPICPPDDAYEPNDTTATATPFPGGTIHAIACTSSNPDYFRVDAARAGQVTATASFTHAAGDIDMGLLNSSGTVVASSTGVTNTESISYNAPGPGTYYVKVYGYSTAKNTYDLTAAAPTAEATDADFDGDGDSDVTVYRPAGNGWFSQSGLATSWGAPGDIPVPGDYNGDGTTDVAVFRPSDQTWYVQPSTSFPAGLTTQWGITGDLPVPADYNGDGTTDIAVFRPSDQTWYVQPSASFPAGLSTQWGIAGDSPVPGDYDGDGDDEVAVFRPTDQTWYSQGSALATQWGIAGDLPIPADYNGDGRTDVAVYRRSSQTWYVQASPSFPAGLATQWGVTGDMAVPGDYDGDGDADVAVFRPSDQTWYVQGGIATQWGATGDIAVIIPYATRRFY